MTMMKKHIGKSEGERKREKERECTSFKMTRKKNIVGNVKRKGKGRE